MAETIVPVVVAAVFDLDGETTRADRCNRCPREEDKEDLNLPVNQGGR